MTTWHLSSLPWLICSSQLGDRYGEWGADLSHPQMNFSILWDDKSREVTHLAYGHTVGCWLQSWPGPSELRFAGRGWHPRLFCVCVCVLIGAALVLPWTDSGARSLWSCVVEPLRRWGEPHSGAVTFSCPLVCGGPGQFLFLSPT